MIGTKKHLSIKGEKTFKCLFNVAHKKNFKCFTSRRANVKQNGRPT